MTKTVVRVWDKDLNFIDSIEQGWRCDEPNKIVVPSDSRVGQFLLGRTYGDGAFLTVDKEDGIRWTGRLHSWDFRRPVGIDRYVSAEFIGHPKDVAEMLEALAELTKTAAESRDSND